MGPGVLGLVAVICLGSKPFGFTLERRSDRSVLLAVCLDDLVEATFWSASWTFWSSKSRMSCQKGKRYRGDRASLDELVHLESGGPLWLEQLLG